MVQWKSILVGIAIAFAVLFMWEAAPAVYHVGVLTYKVGSLTNTDLILKNVIGQINDAQKAQVAKK